MRQDSKRSIRTRTDANFAQHIIPDEIKIRGNLVFGYLEHGKVLGPGGYPQITFFFPKHNCVHCYGRGYKGKWAKSAEHQPGEPDICFCLLKNIYKQTKGGTHDVKLLYQQEEKSGLDHKIITPSQDAWSIIQRQRAGT